MSTARLCCLWALCGWLLGAGVRHGTGAMMRDPYSGLWWCWRVASDAAIRGQVIDTIILFHLIGIHVVTACRCLLVPLSAWIACRAGSIFGVQAYVMSGSVPGCLLLLARASSPWLVG